MKFRAISQPNRLIQFLLLIFIIYYNSLGQEHNMKVHVIDVGQGSAHLIEFECGVILYDVGSQDDNYTTALVKYLSDFFARRTDLNNTLNTIIISHYHLDHVRALKAVLANFEVKSIIDNGVIGGSGKKYSEYLQEYLAKNQAVAYKNIFDSDIKRNNNEGLLMDLLNCGTTDSNLKFRFLSGGRLDKPSHWSEREFKNQNSHSLVLRIDLGSSSILLPGDLENSALEDLIEYYSSTNLLNADILSVNKHGSTSFTREFAQTTSAKMAFISMGKWYSGYSDSTGVRGFSAWFYGHPRLNTIEILEESLSMFRKPVVQMAAEKSRQFLEVEVQKAVYATGWDGTIVISCNYAGSIEVQTYSNVYNQKLWRSLSDNEELNVKESKRNDTDYSPASSLSKLLSDRPEFAQLQKPEFETKELASSSSGISNKSKFYCFIGFPKIIYANKPTTIQANIGSREVLNTDKADYQSFLIDSIFYENATLNISISGTTIEAKPVNEGYQRISPTEQSIYQFTVEPDGAGVHPIHILYTKYFGPEDTRTFPIRSHEIEVVLSPYHWWHSTLALINSNLEFLWASLIVPIFLYVRKRFLARRESEKKPNTTNSSNISLRAEFYGKIGADGSFKGVTKNRLTSLKDERYELLPIENVGSRSSDIQIESIRTLSSHPNGVVVSNLIDQNIDQEAIMTDGKPETIYKLNYQLKLSPPLLRVGDYVEYEVVVDSKQHAQLAFESIGERTVMIIKQKTEFASTAIVAPDGYEIEIITSSVQDIQGNSRFEFEEIGQKKPNIDTNNTRLYIELNNPKIGFVFIVKYRLSKTSAEYTVI